MKKIFLLSIVFNVALCFAQNPIPNPSFSTYWTCPPGQPNNWTDSRDICQVSPGYGGTGWAAQGYKSATTYPAYMTSSGGAGIPISSTYSYFTMYYKFASVSSDVMFVSVTVRNASQAQIGYGGTQITSSAGSFTPLSIPISYSGSGPADVVISILINSNTGGTPHTGTNFIVDDLTLGNLPLAVEEIDKETAGLRVYPNPAASFVQIRTEPVFGKTATIEITNILGQKVREIRDIDFSLVTPRINVSDLAPGNYMVAVKQDDKIQTKRLVVE